MPISSQTPIIGYVANGVTKSFAFPFVILSADDLKVKVGADVVTTGFSIAGVGDRDGGSVTFTDAPASLTPIILYREVTLDRTTDYQENGDLLAIVLDDDLDRIWMALQDQLLLSDRALRSPIGETLQQLPPASERALMALAFDAAGNPIVVRGTNDGGAALALDLMDTAPGKGAALVGFQQSGAGALDRTVTSKLQEFLTRADYNSDANFNAAKAGKVSVDAANRLRSSAFIAGTEELSGPATRDSFVVGRNLDGSTDCHAFADRTIINNVTDAGTYGAFDATTELYGSHTQNHVYAFQDRVRYRGSGTLQNSIGFYSSALHSGSGAVDSRIGMMIDEMAKTGGGTIASQIGILINPLTTGANNVGVNIKQTVGWTLYAGGGAKGYHGGQFGIGTEPVAGAKLHVNADSFGSLPVAVKIEQPNAWSFYCTGSGKLYHQAAAGFGVEPTIGAVDFASASGSTGFLSSDASSITFGALGNKTIKFVTNGDIRLLLDAATYTFKPYGDNTQKLGDASFRWSTVYAGTGAINTSDEREKQQIRSLSEAERAVAVRLKSMIRAFKFNDAVSVKGDAARIHIGLIAQDVKAAFEAEGLVAEDYAILCFDEWAAEFDAEGIEVRPAGNRYGIRYEELLAFIIATM